MAGMGEHLAWLAGLSPWPEDGFGLERMHAVLAALADPSARVSGGARGGHEREVDGDPDRLGPDGRVGS